jgi:hypothetical protein
VQNAPPIYNHPSITSGLYVSRGYIRLQNVSIGYKLNPKIVTSVGIKGLQIYMNGKNLYTWTKWPGYAPDLGTANEFLMRSVTMGIDLSF